MHTLLTKSETKDALLERYTRLGYLHLQGVLSPERMDALCRLVYEEYDAQNANFRAEVGVSVDDNAGMEQFIAALETTPGAYDKLSRAAQDLLRGQLPQVSRSREEFLWLTEEPALLDALKAVLADEHLRVHFPPMVRFKVPGQAQVNVPLHQDAPYFQHISGFVNAWVPFCSITDDCGGVDVLEGSHTLGPVEHQQTVLWENFVELARYADQFPMRHITMEPGDVLIFGEYLLHRSHANTSGRVRCSLDSRWFTPATESKKQYFDIDTRRIVRVF